ncbi:MAG: putative aggregation factor core protein MAFp3, isoform [Bryobacterales bacterium]|nr:putative aggregation factor core protein MAFp3, isoform [Bryobacterales bacterium]
MRVTYIDVLLQNDGSYTGFDVAESSPYRTVSTIPHFEQRFAVCLPVRAQSSGALPKPATNPVGNPSDQAVTMRTGNGNYVVANTAGQMIRFRIFDSQHNLLAETTFPSGVPTGGLGEQFLGLSLADLDQDDKLDLIASTSIPFSGPGGIWVFPGNGDGTFQSGRKQISVGPAGPFTIGDVDGDSKNDVVFSSSAGTLSAVLGNVDFTFKPGTLAIAVPGLSLSAVQSVAIADLNGDGRQDLAVYATGIQPALRQPAISVALGNGQGKFKPATFYPAAFTPSSAGQVLASEIVFWRR